MTSILSKSAGPISVAVSTPPSHGGDSGSSPGSATLTPQ